MSKDIPVLSVCGDGIAAAWENSMIALYESGTQIHTEYDPKDNDGNFIHPPSKDCTMCLTIYDPLSEPMIHKAFPGGLEDLQEYTMEVLDGIKDDFIRDPNDPNDTRWEYTYHGRLFKYDVNGAIYDQVKHIAEKLAKSPYSRRAQAVTWKVWEDMGISDPACLQSIWCRILENEGKWYLNMNLRMRSNDAYGAAMMNIFAFVMLQKRIADMVAELSGREVLLGRYFHVADSYHIYGKDMDGFEKLFLGQLETRSFEERVFNYQDVKPIMDESIPAILEKVRRYKEEHK